MRLRPYYVIFSEGNFFVKMVGTCSHWSNSLIVAKRFPTRQKNKLFEVLVLSGKDCSFVKVCVPSLGM